MADYQLTASDEPCAVIRYSDKACIPPDMANRDYNGDAFNPGYIQWKTAGNVPDPFIPPAPAPPVLDANARLDAGILAAYDVAVIVKDTLQATPNGFNATNFSTAMIQLDALTAAFVEMLKAQMPPEPVPPPVP
jgi:hypothetical protein